MIPVLTPEEMRRVDGAAPEPVEVLIERAGAAVARAAIGMLGGTYGRRVTVIAGKGNNGADGRAAARRLASRGARVAIVDAASLPERLAPCDLVIDAAYGTGFRGTWTAPDVGDAPVLAVDIPSGVDGLTGAVNAESRVLRATCTVTFAALKPGLLFGAGPALAGTIEVADIGLAVEGASACCLVTEADVAARLPRRERSSHKWQAAVLVVGGSPAMAGAPALVAAAAQRAGAGMVRVGIPGGLVGVSESVGVELPLEQWSAAAAAAADRVHAAVLGPGLGRARSTLADVRSLLGRLECPVVLDADGLAALAASGGDGGPAGGGGGGRGALAPGGRDGGAEGGSVGGISRGGGGGSDRGRPGSEGGRSRTSAASGTRGRIEAGAVLPGHRAVIEASARRRGAPPPDLNSSDGESQAVLVAIAVLARREAATILTPHDGEFAMIVGHRPAGDGGRIGDALRLAVATGAVVLLKGPTTVVASPEGSVELVNEGDERLATAGTGDVLAGIIGALLAGGLGAADAASTGAWLHGRAARLGPVAGLVAGDLPELVAKAIESVLAGHR